MGRKLYEASPAARRVFREADETLGFSLSELCFAGPEEDLRQTVNAQPAIMTVSIAYLWAAAEMLGKQRPALPAFVAGHSLGEYTALVAADALDFATGLRLVRERGRLMQWAGELRPGTMAAVIGLDEPVLEAICQETGAQIANANSAEQLVISGTKRAVAQAIDLCRARGARKAIPLDVSGAFHSSLMEPVVRGMTRAIERAPLKAPSVPLVANCTGQAMTAPEALREELVKQICTCVRWQRCVEHMAAAGVSQFVEFGPGRVLTGLGKRIAQELESVTAEELLPKELAVAAR